MKSIAAMLQDAVALQKQGRFDAAEQLYRQVLQAEPERFDALHLLGVLARQTGRPEMALQLISAAIAVDPNQAAAHCNLGAALQDLQRAGEALESYEHALRLQPDYALAWNNRGNALRRLGRPDEALDSYCQALQRQPDNAQALANCGMALYDMQRHSEACVAYRRALQLTPHAYETWNKLGAALQANHEDEAALESYRQATALKPDYAQAYVNAGMALHKLSRHDEAIAAYRQALQLAPQHAAYHVYLGNCLRGMGRADEAAAAYREALIHGADAATIAFALAALQQSEHDAAPSAVPAAAPPAYVRELFDQYAEHFDRHLQDQLDYRTPALLTDALKHFAGDGKADVLDLGCGTGLCAALLKPLAGSLHGVDLSPNMLERARQLGLYDELVCAELGDFLRGRNGRYGIAVAADVFVYIGDLAPVFAAVRSALSEGGLFAFSVEAATSTQNYELRATRRYAHTQSYLRGLAQAHGFSVLAIDDCVLRREEGKEVVGYLAVLKADR